jgi:asparaginyl-tRNA synthetase
VHPIDELRHTGTCVLVEGLLKASPPDATGQVVELHVTKVLHVGKCDAAKYPIAKKKVTLEFLREKIHLRTRTNTIAAVARIRNCLAFATHEFFQQAGFLYVHTPLVTTSDCEGAGEMFQVTTLLMAADAAVAAAGAAGGAAAAVDDLEALRAAASAAGSAVKEAKDAAKAAPDTDPAVLKDALAVLAARKSALSAAEERARNVGGLPRTLGGAIDYAKDFFGQKAFLTVSGQLQGEIYACAMSSVYTFGPTFRAENSHTSRHLAEFWMIEPELAFASLTDDMNCAEDYVRFCCKALLERCPEDMEFMAKMCAARVTPRAQSNDDDDDAWEGCGRRVG